MAYGMKILDQYSNTYYDTSSQGGVFVQFALLYPGQSGTIFLPTYVNTMEITLFPLQSGNHDYSVGNRSTISGTGYKTVEYSAKTISDIMGTTFTLPSIADPVTVLMVFAK